jgi:hypothetical protein
VQFLQWLDRAIFDENRASPWNFPTTRFSQFPGYLQGDIPLVLHIPMEVAELEVSEAQHQDE